MKAYNTGSSALTTPLDVQSVLHYLLELQCLGLPRQPEATDLLTTGAEDDKGHLPSTLLADPEKLLLVNTEQSKGLLYEFDYLNKRNSVFATPGHRGLFASFALAGHRFPGSLHGGVRMENIGA